MPDMPSTAPANAAIVAADGLVNFGIARPDFLAALPLFPGDIPPNMNANDDGVDRSQPRGWRRPAQGSRLFHKMTFGITTPHALILGPASRWTRFLGQMIDGSFAMLPVVLARFIVVHTTPVFFPFMIAGGAWSFFYLFLADAFHDGQSFAKQLLGVRVVDAKTGRPCTFGQSFVRNIFTILGPIDWIFIFGEAHQRLGDKAAGTVVVTAD